MVIHYRRVKGNYPVSGSGQRIFDFGEFAADAARRRKSDLHFPARPSNA